MTKERVIELLGGILEDEDATGSTRVSAGKVLLDYYARMGEQLPLGTHVEFGWNGEVEPFG